MSKDLSASRTGIPLAIRQLFGPPPVLSTEDATAYEQMLSRLALTLQLGDDFIEILLARTVVNLAWDRLRYSRLKQGVIELAHHKRRRDEACDIEQAALLRDNVRAERAKKAKEPAPTPEDVTHKLIAIFERKSTPIEHARAMVDCLADYERLDQLEILTDKRLRAALDDIERYRDGLGRQLRQAVQQVIDADSAVWSDSDALPPSAPALAGKLEVSVMELPAATTASNEVEPPPIPSTPAGTAAGEGAVWPAEQLGACNSVTGVMDPDVATPLGIGDHRAPEIISPPIVDDPAAATGTETANAKGMSPGTFNAEEPAESNTAVPEAVDVAAQVPPEPVPTQ